MYVAPVWATAPFTCHWYSGVAPPFTDVAENTTGSPAQILLVSLPILIEGTSNGWTFIVTVSELASIVVAFGNEAVQYTWSPVVSVLL